MSILKICTTQGALPIPPQASGIGGPAVAFPPRRLLNFACSPARPARQLAAPEKNGEPGKGKARPLNLNLKPKPET